MSVTSGRHDFDDTFSHGQNAGVERAAAKIKDQHDLVLELVHAVRQGGGGGFVDDPEDIQSSDPAGIPGRLALRVIEVRGHGDYGLSDRLAEVIARVVDELAQHLGGDLLVGVLLAVDLEPSRIVGAGYDIEGDGLELAAHLVVLTADERFVIDGALQFKIACRAASCPC